MASSETKIDGVVVVQMSATGSSYLTPALMYGGLSGSLQKLVDGKSYLVAGANVTVTSQSNGQVVISAATTSEGGSIIAESGLYGDGSDGAATINGTNTFNWASKSGFDYTLTRDIYPSSVSIVSGSTLKSAGYRVFVSGTCDISNGTIDNTGLVRFGGSGGVLTKGQDGSLGTAGGCDLGGLGGAGNSGAGTVTGRGPRHLPEVLTMFYLEPTTPGVTGIRPGGGGGGSGVSYGGGGGGFVVLVAKNINVDVSGSIRANGGPGGGENAGGGGGGVIVLVSQIAVVNSGTIQVNGGASGGGSGVTGSVGRIMQFIAS